MELNFILTTKKLFHNALFAFIVLALSVSSFSACKTNESATTPADVTKLSVLIDSCQTLLSSPTLNTDYPASAITDFTKVVNAAKILKAESNTTTQDKVNTMVIQLRTAKKVFLAAAYGAIPDTALLMEMTFDETVANNQFKTAGKGWTAVLKAGPSEIFAANTTLPTFEAGKVGKAIKFINGSHLEISDYTASDLLGKELSISTWINPGTTKDGNYVLSYNYWKTWKFHLQEQNKPCFTVVTGKGLTDADDERPDEIKNSTWTHLVVTLDLNTEKIVFYVNGEMKKEWTSTTKPNLSGSLLPYKNSLPLLVGACTTYSEAKVSFDWGGWDTPTSWNGLAGLLDELKLYNIALTDGQVAKLYKDENK